MSTYSIEYQRRYREANRTRIKNAWWRRFSSYKGEARQRSLPFELPVELFQDLTSDVCFYCGALPAPYNGIDRVDNQLGYTENNVVTACKMCNIAKNKHNVKDFVDWAARVTARNVTV